VVSRVVSRVRRNIWLFDNRMYACNRMMPGYSLNYLFSETHGSHGQEKQHISTCAEIKNHVHKHSLHFILNGNKEEESKQPKIGLPVDHQNEDAEDKKEGRRSPSSNNISKTEDTQTKSSSSSSECSKRKRTIKYCSVKDCPNRSTNRGVCFRHGVRVSALPLSPPLSHLVSL
jgi:hypothetical protein